MDLFKRSSEHDSASTPLTGTPRRTFIRGLLTGVGIAIPAFGVLVSAPQPAAAAIPNINPCTKTYRTLLDQWCSLGGGPCSVGSGGTCVQQWQRRSVLTGQSCGTYLADAGPCGVNCPAGAGSSVPAAC